jgi:dipeptidyl aminopeptidase/acylaminoacyl peptidase
MRLYTKQGRAAVLALQLCLLSGLGAAAQAQNLTIDSLIKIKHPSNPVVSPDGQSVVFLWDQGGVGNLYVAKRSGAGAAPKKITSFESGDVAEAFWSRDWKRVFFPHDGALWETDVASAAAHPVKSLEGVKANGYALSPDGGSVAFVSRGASGADLYVQNLSGGSKTKVAHHDVSIGAVSWSPDGKHLLYSGGAKTIRHEEAPEYSGAKIIYTISERVPGSLFVAPVSGGAAVTLQGQGGAGKWVDNVHVAFDRVSKDFKKRTIYLADIGSGSSHVLHEDIDPKFWSMPGGNGEGSQASPDGKWICFLSDRDGWDHLYVMPAAGGAPVQLTSGHFEAWRPVWAPDSKHIAFDANSEAHPGDRHLFVVSVDQPKQAPRPLTTGSGTNTAPVWTADGKGLVYQHTDTHNSADLFALDVSAPNSPRRLSDSMPAGIDRAAFIEPQFVHYPGADGKPVPGWLFLPKGMDKTKKHPVIVWIHGDGINQNYNGWHVQRNYAVYYSFHQYLLQQGYIVFAPDYRGSIGYGRDWRQGVHMDVGGKDAKDAWLAGNYLKTLPYVDASRMGVWGLSYGGFFTLIAVTDQPTLFRAAVDVAGVVDYRMYYSDPYHGAWTASRIGTPDENPKVYDGASPISHIDRLQHPLLVLHGTADINVPYLESVRLVDEVLKHDKGSLVQFMMYPGEFHYFTRTAVLRDAWRRVDDFFRVNILNAK